VACPDPMSYGARIARAALFAATAWVVAALWAGCAALEVMKRTRWPGWTYRPAHVAFHLLKDTYLPVLWLLALIWVVLAFVPFGRRRWVVVVVALALVMTCSYHGAHDVRE
jgi:hypothetical protein